MQADVVWSPRVVSGALRAEGVLPEEGQNPAVLRTGEGVTDQFSDRGHQDSLSGSSSASG
jgi:hypothetical protein